MTDLIVLTYHDCDVTFDPSVKMWDLNAMHKAAGGLLHKAPGQWLRYQQSQELIEALQRKLNCVNSHSLVETREGRTGGTWAHWQIAAAYAHYLNPDFYLQWNEWALAHVQGAPIASPTTDRLDALEARLAALEQPQAAPTVILLARPLDELATAIIAVLHASDVPRRPSEVERALLHHGWQRFGPHQVKVRMARMAQRGIIRACGQALYTTITSES